MTVPSGRDFAVVLAGGGARGYAHVGVLKALQEEGFAPSGIVGVSMGAVVASTYALREDWYEALLAIDTSGFPHPHGEDEGEVTQVASFSSSCWVTQGWTRGGPR